MKLDFDVDNFLEICPFDAEVDVDTDVICINMIDETSVCFLPLAYIDSDDINNISQVAVHDKNGDVTELHYDVNVTFPPNETPASGTELLLKAISNFCLEHNFHPILKK